MKKKSGSKMKAIIKFLKKYPEIVSIPVAFVVWALSVRVLRFFDETSATFDAGVFQIIIFAVIQFYVFVSIVWLTMKLMYGTLRRYLQCTFKCDFKTFTPWQQAKLSFFVFFALLAVLAFLATTLSA